MAKTALIMGVIGGVGSDVAKRLIAKGWTVIGSVRSPEQVEEARADIPGIQHVVPIDLANADLVGSALSPVLTAAESLDAVILAAGTCPFGPLETTPLSEMRRVVEINAVSAVAVYQATIDHLRRSKGHLVVVTSVSGKVAVPFVGHYCASKFALEALCDVMRRENRDSGIKVVVIEPGGMKSRMVDLQLRQIRERKAALSAEERARYGHMYDTHEYAVSDRNKGLGPPEECADVILDVLSLETPETRYTVGQPAAYMCSLPLKLTDKEIDEVTSSNRVWELT